jgi:hypothetical protein
MILVDDLYSFTYQFSALQTLHSLAVCSGRSGGICLLSIKLLFQTWQQYIPSLNFLFRPLHTFPRCSASQIRLLSTDHAPHFPHTPFSARPTKFAFAFAVVSCSSRSRSLLLFAFAFAAVHVRTCSRSPIYSCQPCRNRHSNHDGNPLWASAIIPNPRFLPLVHQCLQRTTLKP